MNSRDICAINFTGLTHDHSSTHVSQLACRPNSASSDSATAATAAAAAAAAAAGEQEQAAASAHLCSAISILKRHPMYDCLILVKKFRHCLNGYSLEFPIDRIRDHERLPTNESARHISNDENHSHSTDSQTHSNGQQEEDARGELNTCACSQQRLVSRFLDGDDPIFSATCETSVSNLELASAGQQDEENQHSSELKAGEQREQNELDETQTVELRGTRVPFMVQLDDRGDKCELVNVPVNGLLDRLENYTRIGVAVDSRVYAFAMGLKTAERMMTTKSMKELQETPI